MPVEKWSDTVVVVHLGDDPQFTEDLECLEESMAHASKDAVLDFSAVRFINSSNIARLLKLRQSVVERRTARVVWCDQPDLGRLPYHRPR